MRKNTEQLENALRNLRHLYEQMLKPGLVRDQVSAANGLLSPAIKNIENYINEICGEWWALQRLADNLRIAGALCFSFDCGSVYASRQMSRVPFRHDPWEPGCGWSKL